MPSPKYNIKDVPRVCARCGTQFLANKYLVNMGQGQYCNNQCRLKAQNYRGKSI